MSRSPRRPVARRRSVALLVLITGFVLPLRGAFLQDSSSAIRLDLGFDSDVPGHEVLLPLSLDVPPGVEVGQAVSEVSFPGRLLRFEEVLSGLSAQAVNAEVRALPKEPEADSENARVVVTVSVQPGQSLPSGIIAELIFTILEGAPLEETIRVRNEPSALTADGSPAAVDVSTEAEGEVLVTETPPVFACFFYMH